MTHGFRRTRRGIAADLAEPEREILLALVRQTADLLEEQAGGPAAPEEGDDDSFEALMRRAGFADDGPRPVTDDSASDRTSPTDPAVRRLLPDAHHDDAELSAEFRRLTGDVVRDRKLGHLRRAARILADADDGRLRLTQQEATSLLISMTDVRLVLAQRLDLVDDEAAESLSERVEQMDPDDPRFPLALGYEFLTWLQETLALALTP